MQIIYLSPVPWESFAQRPHKFVEWAHTRTGAKVVWVDPYPTRFPLLSDFRRIGARPVDKPVPVPHWLDLIKPAALPIEPLPGLGELNAVLWRQMLRKLEAFAIAEDTLLVVGKPSALALTLMERLKYCRSLYDAMDDFPAFYSGLSCIAMRKRERALVRRVSMVMASSTALKARWSSIRDDVKLVPNGLDPDVLQFPVTASREGKRKLLGYVGTMASWFDWEWAAALAEARPQDIVRLIGPMFSPTPNKLPPNIEILPACSHSEALQAMKHFDIGLIPFKKTS